MIIAHGVSISSEFKIPTHVNLVQMVSWGNACKASTDIEDRIQSILKRGENIY